MKKQKGFTLIELMIILAILIVFASIAIPSYQRYIVKNAESQAQARMMSLQMELERWRASTLSYRNFRPQQPLTTTKNKYTIRVVNGAGTDFVGGINGRELEGARNSTSWVMIAEPDATLTGASRMLLTSSGLRCKSVSNSFCTTPNNQCECGTGTVAW
ncbi:type IV pilin protein [Moraxella equi]|uniref:Serogroup A1 n=1 Tax=Moraxella equi TaxID=60442 RepID=A0A378QUX0_9GAMM|nr:type IV pilin protein [Moraxella equi]MDO5050308.1 type IV pilin protein [Moraxella equi]OPH39685.1 hypothetical protein B5J93_03125 [Moraxella equi]STZ03223.1 Serogroup A1 [Moraxella equi]